MGCVNEKHVKSQSRLPSSRNKSLQLIGEGNSTAPSILFNMLRKHQELEIINNTGRSIFFKESSPNIDALSPFEIKALYSFKNVVVVGSKSLIPQKIIQASNPKKVQVVSQSEAAQFCSRFPIFRAGAPAYQTKQIPLLAYDSHDFDQQAKPKCLFLHLREHENQEAYGQLNISTVVADDEISCQQMSELIWQRLDRSTLFLHSKSRTPNDLLAILSPVVAAQLKITNLDAKIYTRMCLPQATLDEEIPIQRSSTNKTLDARTQDLTISQTYQKYLRQLYQEMGGDTKAREKVERVYNLLVTLISNIYNNKGADSYRRVRKTNKQIDELIVRHKNGVKLMGELGFVDKSSEYINETEVKYLKIYRTDLDVAYRDFLASL